MAPTVCLFPCACACACALSLLGLGSLHGASPDDEATRDHGRGAPPLLRWAHAPRRMCLPDQEIRSPARVSPVPTDKNAPPNRQKRPAQPTKTPRAVVQRRLRTRAPSNAWRQTERALPCSRISALRMMRLRTMQRDMQPAAARGSQWRTTLREPARRAEQHVDGDATRAISERERERRQEQTREGGGRKPTQAHLWTSKRGACA
jgi:hypothetical protein